MCAFEHYSGMPIICIGEEHAIACVHLGMYHTINMYDGDGLSRNMQRTQVCVHRRSVIY